MTITAALVKELRERTGSGMMECKKALVETNGDIEAAIDLMRKAGLAKASKKAGRTAAEGIIVLEVAGDGSQGAMVEVNCETDFVAKGDDFQDFARKVIQRVVADRPADLAALLELPLEAGSDASVETARKALIAKIGENVNVRRFTLFEAAEGARVGGYLHGARIGVLVEIQGGDAALAKDIAMHIAAANPVAVDEAGVPEDVLAREKEIIAAQAAESGKPPEIVEKMIGGRLRKFISEVTLSGQPFVKDPETTVGKLLDKASARVLRFQRFEVGEGIEKEEGDFAAEVMAQVRGA
ncbi:MAG TPA: elongation factor Ts [Gammaproteobacteria bacterium]|nr:elongation factor Ts [Gammaproteobacteria bacterium]